MKAWPRVLYLCAFVGVAVVVALSLNGALRPSISADLLRAALVASLCTAPGLIHRKAWPLALVLVPLGGWLVVRTTLLLPAEIEGIKAQLSYYLDQIGEGARLYTQKSFPMVVGDAPGLRLFLTVVLYGVTAVAGFLAVGLRRPLAGLAVLVVLLGFALTVDETPRRLWGGILFLVLAASLLALSPAFKGSPWRVRDLLPGLLSGTIAAVLALAVLVAVPSAAAQPWQDWRRWDPFRTGGPIYSFNWLQNYPQLLDPANDQPIMEVRSPIPAYWRANVLDTFTGYAWVATGNFPQTAQRIPSRDGYVYDIPAPSNPTAGDPVEQTFSLKSIYTNYLFTGGDPVSLRLRQDLELRVNEARALRVVTAVGPSLDYTLTAVVPKLAAGDLVGLGTDYSEDVRPYRELPFPRVDQLLDQVRSTPSADPEKLWQEVVSERTVDGSQWTGLYALNQQIVGRASDPYEIALRVERYLRSHYQYDLTPPPSDYASPYTAFLFDTQRGYCQHFAGSMALLLRFNGIPARVAVGFTSGKEDPAGTFTVSTNNAHAWVEAFFPNVGWVSFDPTPGRNLPTPGPSSTTPGFVDPFGPASAGAPGTEPTLPPAQPGAGRPLSEGEVANGSGSWMTRPPWLPWLLAVVVMALAVLCWPAARLLWRERGLHHGPPQRRLETSLRLLRWTLVDYRIPVSAAFTWEEVFASIRSQVGLLPPTALLDRLQAVLYGGRTARPHDVQQAEIFRRHLAAVLRRRYGWRRALASLYRFRAPEGSQNHR